MRESIREVDVDVEDIEEEINDNHEFDIQRKESEEELECEEMQKELEYDKREEEL